MANYETKRIFAQNLTRLLREKSVNQIDLALAMNVAPSSVSGWCSGEKMPRMDKIEWMAKYFGVETSGLLSEQTQIPTASNIFPLPRMTKIPLVGQIACGTPILAEENIINYIDMPESMKADFALLCKGDSMIGAGINDGDVVYIHKQCTVENGQIAVVVIDEEATLKRFYHNGDMVQLVAENPTFPPMVFVGEEINQLRIAGRAIAYTHVL